MSLLLVCMVGLLIILLLYWSFNSFNSEEPPGPRPLPLLGNLLQIDLKKLDQSLLQLSKKYGPVFQIYLGTKKAVVLAGYQTVKQALVNHAVEFGNREVTPLFYDFNKEHGILFSNGESWKEMRRFALATLKDFGVGKKMSEEKIREECGFLIKEFERFEGKPFNNSQILHCAATNVVLAVMSGRRYEFSDPAFRSMVTRDNIIVHLAGSASIQIYNLFPWLGSFLKNWRVIMKTFEDGKRYYRRMIKELEDTFDHQICRCFVDAFLIRKQNLEESKIDNFYYHNDNLLYCLINLVGAGNDTTGNTLKWCLLYMAKYPHIQERVVEELTSVIGSRPVGMEDRKNLPYTDAVIHESQRFANIVPMAILHKMAKDVTFQGYKLKKGTLVIPLLTSVLYDESEWESPYTFNPSHFLDEEGRFIRKKAFMPFSAGRRMCLGKDLARMEIFLFFTSLLQQFRFSPPPGVSEAELDLTPVVGFTLAPKPQNLCAVRRQ